MSSLLIIILIPFVFGQNSLITYNPPNIWLRPNFILDGNGTLLWKSAVYETVGFSVPRIKKMDDWIYVVDDKLDLYRFTSEKTDLILSEVMDFDIDTGNHALFAKSKGDMGEYSLTGELIYKLEGDIVAVDIAAGGVYIMNSFRADQISSTDGILHCEIEESNCYYLRLYVHNYTAWTVRSCFGDSTLLQINLQNCEIDVLYTTKIGANIPCSAVVDVDFESQMILWNACSDYSVQSTIHATNYTLNNEDESYTFVVAATNTKLYSAIFLPSETKKCPYDCFFSGRCVDGQCQCSKDHFSPSCNIVCNKTVCDGFCDNFGNCLHPPPLFQNHYSVTIKVTDPSQPYIKEKKCHYSKIIS